MQTRDQRQVSLPDPGQLWAGHDGCRVVIVARAFDPRTGEGSVVYRYEGWASASGLAWTLPIAVFLGEVEMSGVMVPRFRQEGGGA